MLLSDRLSERVTLTNYLAEPLDFWIELSLGCDFADIFEVRGWRRPARGQFFTPAPAGDRLAFRYRGRDGRIIGSTVQFQQPPDRLDAHSARWEFRLASQAPQSFEWEVLREDPAPGREATTAAAQQERPRAGEHRFSSTKRRVTPSTELRHDRGSFTGSAAGRSEAVIG